MKTKIVEKKLRVQFTKIIDKKLKETKIVDKRLKRLKL